MRKLVAGLLLAVTLTGCSATSALTGLVGSKPDVSAQVGAENTKQTVGLNNKVDSSTTNKTDVQDSNVGTLDTSSKKQVQTISTGTIQAERLQVVNNDSYSLILAGLAGASIPLVFLVVILVIRKLFRKKGQQDDLGRGRSWGRPRYQGRCSSYRRYGIRRLVGGVNELELEHYQLHHCDCVCSANPGVECVLQEAYIQAPRGAGT